MTVELVSLLDGNPDRRLSEIVEDAVGALSLLTSKHFFRTACEELRSKKWMHQWEEASTGDRITLYEFLDMPLTWLELQVGDRSVGETIRSGLNRALSLDSVSLADPDILFVKARENPENPISVRNLGVGGNHEHPDVIALLEGALKSPQQEVRRAAADAAVLRRIRALAPALREAATREIDKDFHKALTFAAERCANI